MIRNATYALLCAAALLAGSVSAADKPMLADRHVARGVTCQNCHPGQKPTNEVDMSACLKCHGGSYAALARRVPSAAAPPRATPSTVKTTSGARTTPPKSRVAF